MKLTKFRIASIFVLLFIAVSFLGGSAIWTVLGTADDLTIDGNAAIVRSDAGGLDENWSEYGGDKGGNRYVAADEINADNVHNLQIAWTHQSGTLKGRSEDALSRAALQTTPILVENSLVYCTQFNEVIALEPGTGAEKWRYDPKFQLIAGLVINIPVAEFLTGKIAPLKKERSALHGCLPARLMRE